MNGLFMFLLSLWISSAVGKVEILYIPGGIYSTQYKAELSLDCKITDGETFKAWESPNGFVHNSTDYKFQTVGDEHKLEISEALMRDAGKWTCYSNEGGSASMTLRISLALAENVDKNQNLVKGLTGAIYVNIVGSPPLTFTWSKDGNDITEGGRFSISTNGTLVISNVEKSDSGVYTVTSSQPPQSLTVDDITVTVFELPSFTSVASNKSLPLNGDLVISCAATGDPEPKISWEKDGVALTDSRYTIDNNGLTVKNVQLDDIGSYTCVAKNEAGTEKQVSRLESISVTIVGTPEKTQNLIKGKSGKISVSIVGYPKPVFTWKKGGVDVVPNDRISVAEDGSLVISDAQVDDAGTYEVLAAQKDSKQEIKDIIVEIQVPPFFVSKPVKESRTVGGSISFVCNASGIPEPKITWKKGSDDVAADSRYQITDEGLTISGILETDVGDYTCVANNSVGEDSQTFSLTSVLVPPQLSNVDDQEVERGNTLEVDCNTTAGKPPAQVVWKKNGVAVPSEKQKKYVGGSVLTIKNVQPGDSGKFECFAENGAVDNNGNVIVLNRTMEVSVVYPPEFDATSTKTVSAFGKEVAMVCVVNGKPAPNVSLTFNGKEIAGQLSQSDTQTTLTVSVNITDVNDYGVYTCTASNKLKSDVKHEIRALLPLEKPIISDVVPKCNNVTFVLKQDMSGPIPIKNVLITLMQDSISVHTELLAMDKVNQKQSINRLQEKTTYKLSVKQVTDVEGTGHTVDTLFTTETCELQKINDFVFTKESVVIYWPESKGNVENYIVKYRIKGTEKWNEEKSENIRKEIADLKNDKVYEFQVFVKLQNEKTKPFTTIQEKLVKKGSPETVSRKKGLSGGAIAAIVIVIILLVLIAVDIFCCFFNQCGVVHMCAAACSGRKNRSKYNVDGKNEEGTKLKEIDGEGQVA